MAKFSDLVAGSRALSDPETVEIAPGVSITFCCRVLTPFEAISMLSSARADAKAAGVDEPEAGEPIYEAARAKHTIALGLVDPDSTKDEDPKPFFDGGLKQIEHSKKLTNDVIAYLFELWEHWNESVSLQKTMLDEKTFARIMEEAAVGNARPFFALRPGVRWNFTRTLAARHVNLLKSRSHSSPGSQETTHPQQPE